MGTIPITTHTHHMIPMAQLHTISRDTLVARPAALSPQGRCTPCPIITHPLPTRLWTSSRFAIHQPDRHARCGLLTAPSLGEWENNASSQTSEVPVEDHGPLQPQRSPDEDPRVSNTQLFVQGRKDSYDKHERFQKDPVKERERRIDQVKESVRESCRKYDGSSKKKGAHGDGSGCKPTDKKHHRHDHHGGGGASGAGPSRADSAHKESSRKESKGKESSHKESSRKESKGKGKESSSKSR